VKKKNFLLLFFATLFMTTNSWAINLQNYYFSDAYKYAVIEDSAILRHPGKWVIHLSGAYVKQPLVISRSVDSGDKIGVVVDSHIMGTLGASYYLLDNLAIGGDISYVKQSMSDETGDLGDADGAIARAQAGIDCSAGQAPAPGTNAVYNNAGCTNNTNTAYSIFNAATNSAAGGDIGALGDARARVKWRALRNKKHRIGVALIGAVDFPTGQLEAFNTSDSIRFNVMAVGEKLFKRAAFQVAGGYSHGDKSELDVIDYDKFIKAQFGFSYRLTKAFNANLEVDYRLTIGEDSIPASTENIGDTSQDSMDIYLTGKYKAAKMFDVYGGVGVAGFNDVDLGNLTLFLGLKVHPGRKVAAKEVKIIEEEPAPIVEAPVAMRAELSSVADETVMVGQSISTIDLNELNSGMDNHSSGSAINYVCTYDKMVDDSVSGGLPCTSLPGFQFSESTGVASWTPTSGYEGEYEFNVDGFADGNKFDDEMWVIRVNNLAPAVAAPEVITDRSQEANLGTLFRAERVYFNNNKTNIRNSTQNVSEQNTKLNEVADYLVANEGSVSRVIIEGYASKVGGAAQNQRLSVGRSENVKQYLIQRGVNPSLLQTVAYGDDYLNEEPEHWQNRRVEFRIYNY